MPTYEYECRDCGHNFELTQSMSDEPIKDCPLCGKSVRRLIFGGSGVIFKGSGFYVTDSKGGKTSTSTKEAKSGKTETSSAPPEPAAPAEKPAEKPSEKSAAPKAGTKEGA